MKGYFAYIRVSTAKQGEFGSSLIEQRSSIEAYASRNGLAISEWFEERETAAKLGRTQFNIMMNRLGKRQALGVVIHKIDRSARHLRDWARLGDLMDSGIDVRFAHESLDMGSRGGRLAADIQAVVAADYVRNLRQEIRKGIDGRLKQGLYPLPAPPGYLDCGKAKRKEIDPITGPLVRKAFELYSTGNYTVTELRAEMQRRGLRNRRGGPVSVNGMWKLLRQPFYIGLIHIERTGRTYDGAHQPLIPKSLFDRCQAILSGRAYIRGGKHDLSFARLIKCALCRRSLIGERQKGIVYYRCHSISCRGTSLRESDVYADLCAFLSFLALDEVELGDVGDLKLEAHRTAKEDRAAAVSQAKLALGRCDDLLARLTDAFLDGMVERELFETRKAKLLADRRGYLETIESPLEKTERMELLEKLELANVALDKAETGISAEIRSAVSLVLSNFVTEGKELAFAPIFPFDQLYLERISAYGDPHRSRPRTDGILCTGMSRATAQRSQMRVNISDHIKRWERNLKEPKLRVTLHESEHVRIEVKNALPLFEANSSIVVETGRGDGLEDMRGTGGGDIAVEDEVDTAEAQLHGEGNIGAQLSIAVVSDL